VTAQRLAGQHDADNTAGVKEFHRRFYRGAQRVRTAMCQQTLPQPCKGRREVLARREKVAILPPVFRALRNAGKKFAKILHTPLMLILQACIRSARVYIHMFSYI